MSKNIQTHNAKVDLVRKFLDYANVADASYAMLHYVLNGEIKYKKDGKEILEQVDTQKLGSTYFNKDTNTEQNSTYARAIEARFNEDRTGDWCIPFANKCLTEKDKISNNDITQVKLDSKLSKRTITFTNRFRILAHQEKYFKWILCCLVSIHTSLQ
ncbi:methyltransferase [Helicobacter trogontum]|uniref:methyltransferase n=1 Tax=Helicobacter trogontum TaxID=50960 RepID=UPI000CF1A6B0|nr:methyltransferase [Helicobacter trogontum]